MCGFEIHEHVYDLLAFTLEMQRYRSCSSKSKLLDTY